MMRHEAHGLLRVTNHHFHSSRQSCLCARLSHMMMNLKWPTQSFHYFRRRARTRTVFPGFSKEQKIGFK